MNMKIKSISAMAVCLFTGIMATSFYYQDIIETQASVVADLQTRLNRASHTPARLSETATYSVEYHPDEASALIAELENTVALLSVALTEKQQSTEAHDPELQTVAGRVDESPEFVKSSFIPMKVLPAVSELSMALTLSGDSKEQLADLLQAKAEADFDAVDLYMKKITEASDPQQMEEVEQLLSAQLADNANNYENQLTSFMSDEQIKKYREYEQLKHRQQREVSNSLALNEISTVVQDLNDYQQQEIRRLLGSGSSDIDEAFGLGTVGSPYAEPPPDVSLSPEQLELLLTPEQLQQYVAYLEGGVLEH